MKLTQFDKSFRSAITELNVMNGRLFVLEAFIKQAKGQIEKDRQGLSSEIFMASGLAFRDLTLINAKFNLFMSSDTYTISLLNLQEEIDMIISRECLFHVAQAYEILESYLYDQVAEFIRIKSPFHLFLPSNSKTSSFKSIRVALKSLDDRKNNRHLIRIIRANSKVFADHETFNIHNIDYNDWFEMLGQIRHCITHMRMQLSADTTNTLPKCYSIYFAKRSYREIEFLFLDYGNCRNLLSDIAAYMLLIYKSLVETCFDHKIDFQVLTALFNESTSLNIKDES
jgi:hypothetical protein